MTLSLGLPGQTLYESDGLFTKIHKDLSIYLARTIAVRKAGTPPGRDASRPTLRTQFADARGPGRLGKDQFGRATWCFEGRLETPFWDARTTTTCGATIRYVMHARCPAKVGLGAELHMVARHLELDRVGEGGGMGTPLQGGREFGLAVAGLGEAGRKQSFPSTVSIHSASTETYDHPTVPTSPRPFLTSSPSPNTHTPTLAALPHLPSLLFSSTSPLSPTLSASSLGTDTESVADTAFVLGRRTLGSFPAPPTGGAGGAESPVDFMEMIYARGAEESLEEARAGGKELGVVGHHALVGGQAMEVSRSGGGLGRLFGR